MTRKQERRRDLFGQLLCQRAPGVVDWLQQHIRLPREFTNTPGQFTIASRPFMRWILECFHPESGITDLSIAGGTQLLKTTILAVGWAFRFKHAPCDTLVTVPSENFGRNMTSAKKFQPLIDKNPELAMLKPDDPDKYKTLEMALKTGSLTIAGFNSPAALSGRTCGMVLQEECAKSEATSSEQAPEGHPVDLADERTKNFGPSALRVKVSSPNVDSHPFWRAVSSGSLTRFYVPCPNCPEEFPFEFKTEGDYKSLTWDSSAKDKNGLWHEEKVKASARYVCPKCAYPIQTHEKLGMVEKATPVDMNPVASRFNRSFQASSFYAPTISFGDIAWKFLQAKDDMFGLQNFFNSWLAECYSLTAVQVQETDITALRNEDFRRRLVPKAARMLIMTADPGETSGTHWMVQAWMKDDSLVPIDWGVCLSIEDLEVVRAKLELRTEGGRPARPVQGFIDSKYETVRVYELCRRSRGFWNPTRGADFQTGAWTANKITSYPDLFLFQFSDTVIKTELYRRRIKERQAPGFFLPADVDEVLLSQLSGQKFSAITQRWAKVKSDHLGDCAKLGVLAQWVARAGIHQLGLTQ